jgi:hypothetical protein
MLKPKFFFFKMFSLLFEILTKSQELLSEERSIIELGLCLVVSATLYDKVTRKRFIENKGLEEIIVRGVFCSRSVNIRRNFTHALYVLCHEDTELCRPITRLLLKNMPASHEEAKSDCIEFYELLCKLLQREAEYPSKTEKDNELDYKELMEKLTKSVEAHRSTETRSNPVSDKILIGKSELNFSKN